MAYVTSNTYDGRYLKLTVVEESYSIENNTSTIRWTFESIGGNSNYYGIYNWGVKVGNETIYATQTTDWSAKTFPAAKGSRTGTITVEHNPDGSASDITFHLYGVVYNGGTADHSGSISLTTIPRASSVSFNNGNNPTLTTNNSYGITISMASSSFSHKLYWSLGNATYQLIAEKSAGVGTHSWLVSRNLAQQITNSTLSSSGAGTLICETYNGSTLIGTKTCNFTLSVDSGIVPTLSSSSIFDGNNEVSGKNWGIYLKNKSYMQVSITGSNSNDQGATISRYWCTYEGITYSDTSVSNLNLQLANKALVVGNNKTLTVGVTDTRGRTASANKTYTVVDYYSPSINSYSAYRSNSSGAIADDIYFRYALNCSISSCGNHNPMTIVIKWKIKGSSTNTGTATIKNGVTNENSYNSNGVLGDSNHPIGTNNTYEIIFEVSDAFTTNTRSVDIGPIFELFHFHASGKAVAFGKKSGAGSSEELFEVNMPAKFYNGIQTQIQATANSSSSITGGNSAGRIKWLYNVNNGTTNLFPAQNNANAIMHINKHNGNYDSQLGFSSNGYMYYKSCNGTTLDNESWKRIAFDSDIPSVPASTNYIQRYSWWSSSDSHNANDLRGGTTFAYTGHNCPTVGTIVSFDCSTNNNYTLQLQGSYSGDNLYFRNRNGDNNTWRGWSQLAKVSDLPSTTSVTPTITKSSGNGNVVSGTISAARYGNICTIFFYFNTSGGAINAGSNVMSGSISGIPAPVTTEAMGLGFYGASMYIFSFHSDGTFVIRNIAAQLAKNSERHGIGITYMCS